MSSSLRTARGGFFSTLRGQRRRPLRRFAIEIKAFSNYLKTTRKSARIRGVDSPIHMSDIEKGSLEYYAARAIDPQWRDFLAALAGELGAQMPAEEIRAFMHLIGRRIAEQNPLPPSESIAQLEQHVNAYLFRAGWGWMRIRDLQSSLELLHSCAPLRMAFGEAGMAWGGAILEGLYSSWMRQLGAGEDLQLQEVGAPEGPADTLRFRLAHPSLFA